MAFYKCEPSGGTLSETILWAAADAPTSADTQANKTVTLSDDIDNYKYIKVEYQASSSSTAMSASSLLNVIMEVDMFKLTYEADGENQPRLILASKNSWVRKVFYVTNTSVKFGSNARIGSGSAYANCNAQYIKGLK